MGRTHRAPRHAKVMQHVDRKTETKINPRKMTREDYNRAIAELEPEPCDFYDLEESDIPDGNEDSTSPYLRPLNIATDEAPGG